MHNRNELASHGMGSRCPIPSRPAIGSPTLQRPHPTNDSHTGHDKVKHGKISKVARDAHDPFDAGQLVLSLHVFLGPAGVNLHSTAERLHRFPEPTMLSRSDRRRRVMMPSTRIGHGFVVPASRALCTGARTRIGENRRPFAGSQNDNAGVLDTPETLPFFRKKRIAIALQENRGACWLR